MMLHNKSSCTEGTTESLAGAPPVESKLRSRVEPPRLWCLIFNHSQYVLRHVQTACVAENSACFGDLENRFFSWAGWPGQGIDLGQLVGGFSASPRREQVEGLWVPWAEEAKTDFFLGEATHTFRVSFPDGLEDVRDICLSTPEPGQTLRHGTWHSGVTRGTAKGMGVAVDECHSEGISSGSNELALVRRKRGWCKNEQKGDFSSIWPMEPGQGARCLLPYILPLNVS